MTSSSGSPTGSPRSVASSPPAGSPPHRSLTAPPPGLSSDISAKTLEEATLGADGSANTDDDKTNSETDPPAPIPSVPPPPTSALLSPTLDTQVRFSSNPSSPMIIPSALRRSNSSTSSSGGEGPSTREKKRLRFTSIHQPSSASTSGGLGLDTGDSGNHSVDREEFYYPGTLSDMEQGHMGRRGVPRDQADYLTSDPGTPNIQETADQIRRTLSLASLDSLLLLSADQKHRDRFIAGVSRAGKELVWRDQGEDKLYPRDYERALVLAAKRGLRSGILAFSVRSGVNVLLLLFRSFRKKKLKVLVLLRAILGEEPFRFGAMIGTFTFLNTLALHLFRLAPPLSYFRRRWKFGIWNTPAFGPPMREGDEGERRWQAAAAGAIGSLGLLWETAGRRTGVAQQMFVRGLQASYNQYAPQYGIRIPHGDLLLFGACCGQIMFAWLLSPSTIPHGYSKWILDASRVPEFAVLGNRTIVREGYLEPQQVQRALSHPRITAYNRGALEKILAMIKGGDYSPSVVPCEMVHPWVDSCVDTNYRRFFAVFKFMLPVYSALHLIPMLVLRRHHVQRDPLKMLARACWGITRSCSFLGVFVFIYQSLFCLRSQTLSRPDLGKGWQGLLKRKETFWLMGFSTCLSLLVEEKKRRAELAMYVLPRALESAWSTARKRAWLPIVPFGETILGAAAMAMVMDAYKHKPDAMSGIVRRLLFQLMGPV